MIVLTFEELMSETSELIAGRLGLNFPKERWTDLERGLSSAAKELGFKNAEAIAQWFLTNHINKNQIFYYIFYKHVLILVSNEPFQKVLFPQYHNILHDT